MKRTPAAAGIARPSTFWFGLLGLGVVAALTFREAALTDVAGFLLILAAALVPAALWCWRRVQGLPILPLFALGSIGTFALPLIAHHPLVVEYSEQDRLLAAITVAATILAATLPWYLLSRPAAPPITSRCLILRRTFGHPAFAAILAATIVFNLAQTSLMLALPPSLFSIVRAAIIALSNVSIFLLAHRWGGRSMSTLQQAFHGSLIVAVIISTLPSALMVGALAYGLMALIGYALGRGRLPWVPLAALAAAALFLQGGKEQLRDKYWYSAQAGPISLAEYPAMLADWLRFSFASFSEFHDTTPAPVAPDAQSFVERASLLQLFLRIQQMSPGQVPYLHGGTYTIIPGLLVPRAFNEKKERTHYGTYLLAIHYDLQTREDTVTTTIGFGLINEAMANFGYPGCLALGVSLGTFYGAVARWSAGYPLLSLRSLLAILVLSVAFQNEFSAGVYVTTLFQGACVLLALAPLIMHRAAPAPRSYPALVGAPA